MTEAMTIVEHAKSADDLTRGVVDLWAMSSDILEALPFMSISGGAYPYILEDALGGIAFRGVNETFTPDIGVENPQVESLFTAGGEMDIDNFLIRTQGEGRRTRETTKKAKQMARSVTDAILSGDNTVNRRTFDGLQRRLTGAQKISNDSSAGGGALSFSKLDEAIAQCVEPTHIIMPKKFRDVYLPRAARDATFNTIHYVEGNPAEVDLARRVPRYNGLPILVGYETGPDTKILPFTEPASNDAAAVTTSIYVVSFKEGHVMGIQSQPMIVTDLGEVQSKPARRTRVEWDCGMVVENPYAAVRLHDITDAAIVA